MSGHSNQIFGWRYENMQQAMIFHTTTSRMPWAKLYQSPQNHVFVEGNSYELTYTLSDVPAAQMYGGGNIQPLEGRIKGRIVINSNNYDFSYKDTVGTHTQQITLTNSTSTSNSSYNNHFLLFVDGNVTCRGMLDGVRLDWVEAPSAQVKVKITNIDLNPPTQQNQGLSSPLPYMVDKYIETGSLFKDKLVRFSHRYKYIDGEYSTYAPFTGVAFSPGNFDYSPIKGYNLGMTNQLKSLELNGFVPSGADGDLEAIDILAKIEDSPIIYLVDTIRKKDLVPKNQTLNSWDSNKYIITSDTVKGALPANQLLRPWDNLPKQALGQEMIGNRLVYANYKQGYDLVNLQGSKYKPEFNISIENADENIIKKRSIKSERDYQVGVVFLDEYGRETPVVSNSTGSFHINKLDASNNNIIQVTFENEDYPVDAMYYKFFVKETDGEYYNVALGRNYTDDEGDAWLSFPSSERNKVDEDTFLSLKKGVDSDVLVQENANYKVLAIENEAPDFIKTSKLLIEKKTHNTSQTSTDLFGDDLQDAPIEGVDTFKINYLPFNESSGNALHEITDGDLYIEFSNTLGRTSERYAINIISTDLSTTVLAAAASYSVKLKKPLGDDVNFITDDVSGNNSSKISDTTVIKLYKFVKNDLSSAFAGKFFVKIEADDVFNKNIKTTSAIDDREYSVIRSQKLFFMNDDHTAYNGSLVQGHATSMTGLNDGAYQTSMNNYGYRNKNGRGWINWKGNDFGGDYPTNDNTNNWVDMAPGSFGGINDNGDGLNKGRDFSQFAVFFRNYKYANNSETLLTDDGTSTDLVGRFKFGSSPGDWKKEFLDYTSAGNERWDGGYAADLYDSSDNYANGHPQPTQAGDIRQPEDEVWFIDKGPYITLRGSSDNLHWTYIGGVEHVSSISTGFVKPYSYKNGIIKSNGYWHMDVAQGGIFGPMLSGNNPSFFGANNTNYQDEETVDIVNKHNPGTQFRFREDPTETVYTIMPSTTYSRTIRYSANYDYADQFLLNNFQAPMLSPNFTNNRTIKVVPEIAWDPTMGGVLGPIENGYHLSVNATTLGGLTAGNTTVGSLDDYFINIASEFGTDPVYGTVLITEGMIVTSYNNGNELANPLIVKSVAASYSSGYKVSLTGYKKLLEAGDTFSPTDGETIVFQQPSMNGYSENSTNRINQHNKDTNGEFSISKPGLTAVGYTLDFVSEVTGEQSIPDNPAIFETEPKTQGSANVYYEASGANAIELNETTIGSALPVGAEITSDLQDPGYSQTGANSYIPVGTVIAGYIDGNTVLLSNDVPIQYEPNPGAYPQIIFAGVAPGNNCRITRSNGSSVFVTIQSIILEDDGTCRKLRFKKSLLKSKQYLNWHNCYSFGNGVESNRIKDVFNKQYIANGVKVSTTLDEVFGEEHRKNSLIFSGIYNSNSGVNNLNQFIQAEKITKDLSPAYGSIQKLYARDSDLLALCEDKCIRILANKDAIFNADGNPQLTANENVLGQAMPFSGDYGISKNPESFASESYRVYFTDRVRGAVIRLSKDGLTPISEHGMKSWFRDNLSLGITNLFGENNLDSQDNWDIPSNGNSAVVNGEAILGYYNNFVMDDKYGMPAYFKMNNVLEVGKKYRLQFDVIEHSGLQHENGYPSSITINNSFPGSGWRAVPSMGDSRYDGTHINVEWIANSTDFQLLQYQVNNKHDVDVDGDGNISSEEMSLRGYINPDGGGVVLISDFVDGLRLNEDPNYNGSYGHRSYLYGGIVKIKNLILEEVKEDLTIIGSYDDKENEYNVTIHGENKNTVTFKEDTKGWSTFKSFLPENGLSCANDYYTMSNGKLWQHHNKGVNRNTFYNTFKESSVNVLLNESPGSVKSFKTLNYEGSQSRVEGIRGVTVGINSIQGAGSNPNGFAQGLYFYFETKQEMNDLLGYDWDSGVVSTNIKQYRGGILIREGFIYLANTPDTFGFVGRWNQGSTASDSSAAEAGDWEAGDIITSSLMMDINHFNMTPKQGWYVSDIITNKQRGSLSEFIEKEGKWFNYIKGTNDSIHQNTDFAAFNIQGIGLVSKITDVTAGPPPAPSEFIIGTEPDPNTPLAAPGF